MGVVEGETEPDERSIRLLALVTMTSSFSHG